MGRVMLSLAMLLISLTASADAPRRKREGGGRGLARQETGAWLRGGNDHSRGDQGPGAVQRPGCAGSR